MGIQTSKNASTFLPNTMDFGILENMLQDTSVTPICLPVEFLKGITCNFSEEQELGRGGYGVVYKGILQNGKMIAVKKLFEIQLEDDKFQREVTYLIGVKHQNIVQLVGYCAESRWEATRVSGAYVMAETRKRLLCFEYLQNNSLDKHLSAESCGLEWQMRYDIIRGVCSGLHYLHEECRIVHLDLKPQNILLDDSMLPKLADFGMSRLFGEQQSRIITGSRGGTFGYMAPEYITNGLITTKSDIFSLGVIIVELMTGCREYPQISEIPYEHFVENVVRNWRHRLEKTVLGYIALEICSQQVKRCIVLALKCVNPDPKERPSAWDIIQLLNEPESTNCVFDKNEEPIVGQEPEILTILGSNRVSSSNSATKFDKIMSMRTLFRSTNKGRMISILAFEVANIIIKAAHLMKSISEQKAWHLEEGLLRFEGVYHLISEDYNFRRQFSNLIEDDMREDLTRFSIDVIRFGNQCKDPIWHNLDRYFCRRGSDLTSKNNSSEAAPPDMKYLIKLAQQTRVLHQEMLTLERLQYALDGDSIITSLYADADLAAVPIIKKQIYAIKNQRGVVKALKKKSLWSKNMEDIVEKLVEIVRFVRLKINLLWNHAEESSGSWNHAASGLWKHVEQSSGELHAANNLTKTLGAAGLALHYADVILQIKTLALASPAVPDKAREALYQALPPRIRSVLCIQLRRHCPRGEKQTMTVAEVRAEIGKVLQWLVPAAESTRLYHVNGAFGEWAMKGMEGIDVDKANWFEQDSRFGISSMLRHEDAKVSKVETLYYADKERTEGYILDLVLALHRLRTIYKQAEDEATDEQFRCEQL